MNTKKLIIMITLIIVCSSCYDFLAHSHNVSLDNYVGRWQFTGSINDKSTNIDSIGYLILYGDSTLMSDFSYFWDQDSSHSDTLIGTWYPWETATYRDNYYIELIFTINNKKHHWRVNGSITSGNMIWYSDEYGQNPEFYWSI